MLVELKRATDTRLRREVVGQMLDYAANGTAYWQAGRVAESFAATARAGGKDPDQMLDAFLSEGQSRDAFWGQVDANFAAGRIKLMFVADRVPRELARIVEFLNEQMKADVRAVELNWFAGNGVTALSPRVIGETERAASAKAANLGVLPPLARDEWVDKHLAPLGPELVRAAAHFVSLVEEAGGHAEVTKAQGSIIAVFDLPGTTLYPLSLAGFGGGMVTLNLAYLKSRAAFAPEPVRQAQYDALTQVVGPLSTKSLGGYPAFPAVRLNDLEVREGLAALLRDMAAAAEAGA